jgi:hypothetical protein
MTITIGAKCIGGSILIADRNIINTDGSKTTGCKLYSREFGNGHIALASAATDAFASEYLAWKIIDDVATHTCASHEDIAHRACDVMQAWHYSYGAISPPSIQYLMVACAAGNQGLYMMEPPAAKLEKHAYAIGCGARVAEQSLSRMIPDLHFRQPEATLMYLVYLAKQAEKYESNIGGGFDALYVPSLGPQVALEETELNTAAEIVESIDESVDSVLQSIMSMTSADNEVEAIGEFLRISLTSKTKYIARLDLFPTLSAALTPSISQKSRSSRG